MKRLATANLGMALNEFINDLRQNPVINDRFTANFSLTDLHSGIVEFRHIHSARTATAQWSAVIADERIQVELKYNNCFVLLHSDAGDFREQLASKIPVF